MALNKETFDNHFNQLDLNRLLAIVIRKKGGEIIIVLVYVSQKKLRTLKSKPLIAEKESTNGMENKQTI